MDNVVDIGLGIILLLFLVRGLLRGLISEAASFVGLFLSLLVAGRYSPLLEPQFTGFIAGPRLVAGLSYVIVLIAVLIVVALCGTVIKHFLQMTLVPWLDNLLGAAIGAATGLFICSIALVFLYHYFPDASFLKVSRGAVYLQELVTFSRPLIPSFLLL